jgi:hypothetical protein
MTHIKNKKKKKEDLIHDFSTLEIRASIFKEEAW